MSGSIKIYCLIFVAVLAFFGCNSPKSNKLNPKEKAKKGEVLFNSVGCTTCHSVTGEARYGPSLTGILNTKIQVIHEGTEHTIIIDREYILRSIQDPDYEKLISFKSKKMPKTELSPEEIELITDYLISINEN